MVFMNGEDETTVPHCIVRYRGSLEPESRAGDATLHLHLAASSSSNGEAVVNIATTLEYWLNKEVNTNVWLRSHRDHDIGPMQCSLSNRDLPYRVSVTWPTRGACIDSASLPSHTSLHAVACIYK